MGGEEKETDRVSGPKGIVQSGYNDNLRAGYNDQRGTPLEDIENNLIISEDDYSN